MTDIKMNGESLFSDPLLRQIWDAGKREPSGNIEYRCTGMIMLNSNTEPVWIKIPCDRAVQRAVAVCVSSEAEDEKTTEKKKCTKDLPEYRHGVVLGKRGPQWSKSITCPHGWVMNWENEQCYVFLSTLKFVSDNKKNYFLAQQKCFEVYGEMAEVSDQEVATLSEMLRSMKVKTGFGPIWVKKKGVADRCTTLKPRTDATEDTWEMGGGDCDHVSSRYPIASVLCMRPNVPTKNLPLVIMFQCADGAHVLKLHVCDGIAHCKDGSDELDCVVHPRSPLHFKCENGNSISWSKVCDGRKDCSDVSDENICPLPQSLHGKTMFTCSNGPSIRQEKVCDVSPDCSDGSDEKHCESYTYRLDSCLRENRGHCPKYDRLHRELGRLHLLHLDTIESYVPSGFIPLGKCAQYGPDLHPCGTLYDGCFKKSGICLRDKLPNNSPAFCKDREHLANCEKFVCPGKFKCAESYCLPMHRVCDGTYDCPSGDDEVDCDQFRCDSLYCGGVCLSAEHFCDGLKDCPDGDDELLCEMICPANCTCFGLAMNCNSRSTTSDPVAISRKVKALFLADNNLDFWGVQQKFSSTDLRFLLLLDLSSNEIESLSPGLFLDKISLAFLHIDNNKVTTIPEDCFGFLKNLRELTIDHNPLRSIQRRGFAGLRQIHELDLADMFVEDIGQSAFSHMTQLQHLNLSRNRIASLGPDVFHDLEQLTHLNLSGNSLKLIDPSAFHILPNLEFLQTDDYKFCCAAPQVKECLPGPDVYSSCNDLMSSQALRVFIWILGFFSLIGNVAVVCYRSQIEKPSVLSFLVYNLGVADFMMGIYLLIIAGADASFRGFYYLRDSFWRSHFMCRSAGFLSMLSSEMSVYVLILITTDRVLTVGLGRKGLNDTTGKVLTISAWALFVFLSLLPVMNLKYFGTEEYIQHGVCFLFNLTEGKVSGWEYATAIFIGFNLFAVLYLAVGYSFTFVSVMTKTGLSGDAEVQLARKLALVVLTDCLCWIPPIVIGIVSLTGHRVDPQVSMWIAVFVFPINSAVNPFLYTFSTCGKKPPTSDESDDGNAVTQCQLDGQNECDSVADLEDYESLQGAVGGGGGGGCRAGKTVRFISVIDEITSVPDKKECDSLEDYQDLLVDPIEGPISRVNSTDSGIVAFCIEDSPNNPRGLGKSLSCPEKSNCDPGLEDTHF